MTFHPCYPNNPDIFFSSVISNQSIRYSMSWCAGCLLWWGPLQRGDLSIVDSIIVDWVMAPRNWGFNLKSNSTNYLDHGHHGDPPPTRKISHGTAGNRTRDLVVSSQKLWPPDHEAGRTPTWRCIFSGYFDSWWMLYCLWLNFNPSYGNHLIQSIAVIVSSTARGHALSSAGVQRYK